MFVFDRVEISSPARKASQGAPSPLWILAAGRDTLKELGRSFSRRWDMFLEEVWGRMLKVLSVC